ncbi:MAG: DNA N-6-adenine-methyltransferase [Cyanobacteria bacterium P01_A01_bin.84]
MAEVGRKLRQLDLCSGIGAGFPLSGIITGKVELCGLCEIDEFCKERLRDRFPGIPIYNDVRNIQIKDGRIDCITSSPPCQPFTVEGKRLGGADKRDCIPAILRLVGTIKPKYFCLENVPGLLSAPRYPGEKPGSYFKQMLWQLCECGYDAEWTVVGTKFKFGTKWSGKRLLLIATSRSLKLQWQLKAPGTTKSEAKAKKLGILQKNEVFNPEWLEQEFGLPIGWTDPQEHRAATELLERVEQHSEIVLTPELQRSHGNEYFTSTRSALVKEPAGEYSTTTANTLKAISLWQPWASLIKLGLKHYETRSWKTKYRGKLLICSTAKSTKDQYQQYLKIGSEVKLPDWDETNFPRGYALAVCDLVDCIEMTPEFISQQSQTEILCGDWQVGRYAWKLKNIQPITEPFAVKGKQGLFNVTSTSLEQYLKKSTYSPPPLKSKSKSSDCWYTPPHIFELVVQVLGQIDLDPCADDGKHLEAKKHYTIIDDGLTQEWEGKVYMNPPFSHPGLWMKKVQAEMESGRVTEAIALVPAATDTRWLSPILKSQPVCFWTGRIKFLDKDYKPKNAARQSHVLVYWGKNWHHFKDVFEPHGFVSVPSQLLGDKQNDSPSNLDSSPSKTELSPSKNSPSNLLGDKEKSSLSNSSSNLLGDKEKSSPSKIDLSPELSNPSNLLGDKEKNSPSKNASPSKKRLSGKGNGYIHWRSIIKNGKEYPQAYYHWREGCKKRSKYIPKKLLGSVEEADSIKRPVIEILKLLGVETSPSKLLGDEENNPSNNVSADISDSTEKLLGDKWIKNGEINVSQGVEVSPSNLDNSPSKIDLSPSKRRKGDGSGSIHWRTITRGRKDYPQAYYHYEVWKDGDRLVKSSKYIPKRLLSQVQRLEAEKAPIKEILRLLGVVE